MRELGGQSLLIALFVFFLGLTLSLVRVPEHILTVLVPFGNGQRSDVFGGGGQGVCVGGFGTGIEQALKICQSVRQIRGIEHCSRNSLTYSRIGSTAVARTPAAVGAGVFGHHAQQRIAYGERGGETVGDVLGLRRTRPGGPRNGVGFDLRLHVGYRLARTASAATESLQWTPSVAAASNDQSRITGLVQYPAIVS